MHPRWRWSLISVAAIATAAAAVFAPDDSQQIEVAAPRDRRADAQPPVLHQQPLVSAVDLPRRAPLGRQRGDPFAARSWAPPPPVAQKAAPPQPPPNPYRFAGTVQHDGQRKVFLLLGDRVIEAKEGEKLEQGFRVRSMTAEAVTLVYEPLDMPVTMALTFSDAPAAAGASAPPTQR